VAVAATVAASVEHSLSSADAEPADAEPADAEPAVAVLVVAKAESSSEVVKFGEASSLAAAAAASAAVAAVDTFVDAAVDTFVETVAHNSSSSALAVVGDTHPGLGLEEDCSWKTD